MRCGGFGRSPHFGIDAWVALPDHMHAVWTLPDEARDFAGRWRAINGLFSCPIERIKTLSASRSI